MKIKIPSNCWPTKLQMLVSLVIFAVLLVYLYVIFNNTKHKAWQTTCASSMKMLYFAFGQYTQDYNGKLPPANKWSDAVHPYAKHSDLYHCPVAISTTSAFSFLDQLDRKVIKNIPNPDTTPMLFESDGGWNSALPITKAVPRHYGGYNCCYVDGHVKLITGTAEP